jgi:transcriptional regulator with XRE-family HTH domain
MTIAAQESRRLVELIRLERRAFAAKIRIARALLCWSQGELALHVGLTQRAIHKLEQGETEPRRATVYALEQVWRDEGIEFEDDGHGFRLIVRGALLDHPAAKPTKRRRAAKAALGVTAQHPRLRVYRS